jgi:hypothetical protein
MFSRVRCNTGRSLLHEVGQKSSQGLLVVLDVRNDLVELLASKVIHNDIAPRPREL